MKPLRVALAGNPNAGKSTLFNALTGANQRVGNWPGKTVERKEGWLTQNGLAISLIDLPGAYSLTAFSQEETITRDYLVQERPHLVINVVDAANLERNLYFTVQLLELALPTFIVLNMTDVVSARGWRIDRLRLTEALGVPVLETIARKGTGLDKVRQHMVSFARELQLDEANPDE